MKKILIVDDRASTVKVLSAILSDEGYEVIRACSGPEALELYKKIDDLDAVISDFKMPRMDGLQLFKEMDAVKKAPPFIIMSAYGTVPSAVQALKEGVTHYLIKPLDYEELIIVLKKAIQERETALELNSLKSQIANECAFHGIISCDRKMMEIFDMIRTIGKTDVAVTISGETGTGKELIAKALHRESRRRDREMVCINSGALTENLLEAELFGYAKGAFTGAETNTKGRLEIADQGTLFLDEIGHMSLRLQVKLLRFLQEKTFEPVGSTQSKYVDARTIAATNLDLQKEIREGRFLKDLLYRIEVINIEVPPLRERVDDICLLTQHFLMLFAKKYEKEVHGIEPEAMNTLSKYHWPGNVRELKNYMARAVILSKKPKICLQDLRPPQASATEAPLPENTSPTILNLFNDNFNLKHLEKQVIQAMLGKHVGNKSLAAKQLGISRKTLYKKLAGYEID
jgi:DNA-binding NtrC family response regulator